MNSFDITDFYYSNIIGIFPEHEKYIQTEKTFNYLKDAGFSNGDILKTVIDNLPYLEEIRYENLPDCLWNNTLLERDKFYFHKELQISKTEPTWNQENLTLYIEPKIVYNIDDALDYFIERTSVREEWVNRDKEKGSIKYLLKDYKKFNFIEPIDFFLHLVDFAVSKDVINTVYDLREYEIELAEFLEVDIQNARALGKDSYIWR